MDPRHTEAEAYKTALSEGCVEDVTDYPLIAPDRWPDDFEKIAIRDNVRPLILKENAMRLFGLA